MREEWLNTPMDQEKKRIDIHMKDILYIVHTLDIQGELDIQLEDIQEELDIQDIHSLLDTQLEGIEEELDI